MFGKKNSPEESTEVETTKPTGKGRPTPKRREAEAARRRDLIPSKRKLSKEERKELKARQRLERNRAFKLQEEAMRTGDERLLPEMDKGKARRFIRDFVDSRTTMSEWLMPVAIAVLLMSFFLIGMPAVQRYVVIVVYTFILMSFIETFIMWRVCKRQLEKNHPRWEIPKWSGFYLFRRAINLRRLRRPWPQVNRGERPA
ncbi:DUF3043 domain-containing protein [Actinomycetaceae bacterium TAE3-ERU4]|nr:DUF3043 domain-containing protein [Actinomycetaceae bacterium TAE3-ERU4]